MHDAMELLMWAIIAPCILAAAGAEWWRRSSSPATLKTFDAVTVGLVLILAWTVLFVWLAPPTP